ncbi:MAG: tetraacyldisaccharide 4'-kinase [Bacteroidetes bacterium]|nr:tetraacyldisaccharide 4'-kinase [Bacteroidota bacterium]
MKILLFPFALIYHFVLFLRHKLFDIGILPSESFGLPVICIGNLNLGGTGKTPHTEYIIRLFMKQHEIAVLSRGYKRKTKGFILGSSEKTSDEVGDEPKQYISKFPNITVAVDEQRRSGIKQLLKLQKPPEIILLDDAFQHRYVKPGLNILLTDYHNLYTKDYLVPAGRLRDIKSSAKRADIIVVTKTPAVFSPFIEQNLLESLKPKRSQTIYYSFLKYGNLKPVSNSNKLSIPRSISTILLITGIENPYPLKEHLNNKCIDLIHMPFSDHHVYSEKEINDIVYSYNAIIGRNKIIITTEKDAARLADSPYFRSLENLPLFFQPIEIGFHQKTGISFDEYISDYVRKNLTNKQLHQRKD